MPKEAEILLYEFVKVHQPVDVKAIFEARGDVPADDIRTALLRMLLHNVVRFDDSGLLHYVPAGEWVV